MNISKKIIRYGFLEIELRSVRSLRFLLKSTGYRLIIQLQFFDGSPGGNMGHLLKIRITYTFFVPDFYIIVFILYFSHTAS